MSNSYRKRKVERRISNLDKRTKPRTRGSIPLASVTELDAFAKDVYEATRSFLVQCVTHGADIRLDLKRTKESDEGSTGHDESCTHYAATHVNRAMALREHDDGGLSMALAFDAKAVDIFKDVCTRGGVPLIVLNASVASRPTLWMLCADNALKSEPLGRELARFESNGVIVDWRQELEKKGVSLGVSDENIVGEFIERRRRRASGVVLKRRRVSDAFVK